MKELIKGGKAEGMDCEAIAKKHKVPVEDIKAQEKKGIVIEHEHTPDDDIAAEISRDHLVEHPFYYDYLEEMEKEMEKDYEEKEYGKKDRTKQEESEDKTDADKVKRLKKLFG
jgi:hypothetical protein